jgi:capsular polysaccharide biosynthesis protein
MESTTGWGNFVEDQIADTGKLLRKVFFFHFKLFTKRKSIVLIDSWSSGYFHWIADVLPKLYLLRNELGSWDVILPKKLNHFQEESLQLFNLKNTKSLESWQVGICPQLHLMKLPWQSGFFDNDVYNSMSKWIVDETLKLHQDSTEINVLEYIFVSRQNALSRRILNFADLLPVLNEFKFFTPDISCMGVFDQVTLFSKARVIAGAHGAGLVNMMFMPAGSIVIEFRNSYPVGNNTYERLAKKFKHQYFPIVPENNNYKGNFQEEDIFVSVEKLKEILANSI